jgi:hypothetical protein
MGKLALRLHTSEPPPAETPAAVTVGQIVTDAEGRYSLAGFYATWPVGATLEAKARNAQRYALEELAPRNLAVKGAGGAWFVVPFAPHLDGATFLDHLAAVSGRAPATICGFTLGPNLTAAWEGWGEGKRRRLLRKMQLSQAREQHAEKCKAQGVSARQRDQRFNAEYRDFAAARGCGHVKDLARAADGFRRAILADRDPDARGRPHAPWTPPAELAEIVKSIALDGNGFPIVEGIRAAQREARRKGIETPGPATWRRWFRERCTATMQAAIRKGPRAVEMSLIPKMRRDLSAAEFLQVVESDSKREDVQVRVPDIRTGWARCRNVVLTAFVNVGHPRVCLGWDVRVGETAEGIAAAAYMMLTVWGKPQAIRSDNGRAVDAALGERGPADEKADALLGGLCAQLGIRREGPPPYRPWSKGCVERFFGTVADFEKSCGPAYWGGSPAARPETRDRETRENIMALPTVEQLRAGFGRWLDEVYHATPQEALDGLTPRLAAEQCRGRIDRVPEAVAELVCALPTGKPRNYGRDGVTVAGWLFRCRDAEKHVRLIGRKVLVRRPPWSGDYVILTDETGAVVARPERVALTSVSASREELREVAREQARCRRALKAYHGRRLWGLSSNSERLAELKSAELRANEEALRKQLPEAAKPAVTIVGGHLLAKAAPLLKTGTDDTARAVREERDRETLWRLLATPAEAEPRQETPDELRDRAFSTPMPTLAFAPEPPSEPTAGELLMRLSIPEREASELAEPSPTAALPDLWGADEDAAEQRRREFFARTGEDVQRAPAGGQGA